MEDICVFSPFLKPSVVKPTRNLLGCHEGQKFKGNNLRGKKRLINASERNVLFFLDPVLRDYLTDLLGFFYYYF